MSHVRAYNPDIHSSIVANIKYHWKQFWKESLALGDINEAIPDLTPDIIPDKVIYDIWEENYLYSYDKESKRLLDIFSDITNWIAENTLTKWELTRHVFLF